VDVWVLECGAALVIEGWAMPGLEDWILESAAVEVIADVSRAVVDDMRGVRD
jgi:hypothetical protein